MRCPDCGKFVSMESQEPELTQDPEVDEKGAVTAEVRIVRACADCSTELKEASLNLEGQVDVDKHTGEEHELECEWEEPSEVTERGEGKGRGLRTFYGVDFEVTVKCSCGETVGIVTLKDDVQASAMDEMT